MESILDLPEPRRSEALAAVGMTAEEFRAYLDGWVKEEAYLAAEAEAGRYPKVARMHYGDDFPEPLVVKKGR